jgi:hypothetical protein
MDDGEIDNDQTRIPPGRDADIVSLARRRVMKAGLASVPIVITLRGRPLFGTTTTASITASIAASRATK